MTQITSTTGPVSSLRSQLRAQAEAALGTDTHTTPFTDRLGDAIREVAVAQNSAASMTKKYELDFDVKYGLLGFMQSRLYTWFWSLSPTC